MRAVFCCGVVQNKPKVNEDPKDALLRQMKDEIEALRQVHSPHIQTHTERNDLRPCAKGGDAVSLHASFGCLSDCLPG